MKENAASPSQPCLSLSQSSQLRISKQGPESLGREGVEASGLTQRVQVSLWYILIGYFGGLSIYHSATWTLWDLGHAKSFASKPEHRHQHDCSTHMIRGASARRTMLWAGRCLDADVPCMQRRSLQ